MFIISRLVTMLLDVRALRRKGNKKGLRHFKLIKVLQCVTLCSRFFF